MKRLILVLVIGLVGCVAAPPKAVPPKTKTVVVLGNKSVATVCPVDVAEEARAEKWKAYAERLETELGIPHLKEN